MPLSRKVIDALLPLGSLWTPEDDADLDKLLDGIGANFDALQAVLAELADLRNPQKTTLLADLEKEYGLLPSSILTEQETRDRLEATMTAGNSDGVLEFMQEKLQAAGFPVTVYANSPVADPALFTTSSASATTGNNDAIFNKDLAVFGGANGFMLVNGPIYYNQDLVIYTPPVDPIYWPMVFFIGGDATFDVGGELLTIEKVQIPISRKVEFIRLIIKYKPLHSWAGVAVQWVNDPLVITDPNTFAAASILFAYESWLFA